MKWVPPLAVIAFHDRQISRHSGGAGLRDRSLLNEGLERPVFRYNHGETDLHTLAANYAFGIAKAHAFVDGNKRTAFVTMAAFLRLNGYGFRPDPIEGVRMMEDLARDAIGEADIAEWVRQGMVEL